MTDTLTKNVLGIVPAVYSLAILGESLKIAGINGKSPIIKGPKHNLIKGPSRRLDFLGKPSRPIKSNNLVKGGVNLLVGTALLGGISSAVNNA